jgi:hypothetical protein
MTAQGTQMLLPDGLSASAAADALAGEIAVVTQQSHTIERTFVGHETTVSKVGEKQLFYLMTHGLDEEEASKLIVNGFIEPIVRELPMEYAVEMNHLIERQMEGSIS